MSRTRWSVKIAFVLLIGAAAALVVNDASKRFELAFDVQKYYSCLPFELFLVDRESVGDIGRGELIKFDAPENERFNGQFEIVKIAAGVAGDEWTIENDRLFVNGEYWGELHLMGFLGLDKGSLDGRGTVPEDHLFVLGTTPSSYDSRYWGAIATDSVKGRAYVLL